MNEATTATTPATSALVPFVPRLTLEWLRDEPERLWKEVDGTVAFIDISGFTAMSEKLSSKGRAGAEEVTEVMNATFAALLGVAYAQGGGLLKFGGDALLLLYEGDEHAGRAARAAFEMRRTLRAIGRPRTSAGAVQLKMHAGLHSGRFHFFLVGESHRELLISGPSATRTVEMEAASEAGEILVSPEAATLLPEDALAEEKESGRLLRAAPEVRGTVEPLPSIEEIPLEIAVPAPLRAQLLEIGPLEGEHRHASIAFVRFAGVDEVIATEGPEAAADALEVLVRAVQAAAEEHHVTFLESDIDKDGGRIVLVAGAPQTFGDDEERMLRTVRAVVDAGLPLPVHIGVSEGRVFTGQVGASFRRTYTVLGDTAALAARLMARSSEDEIWVSATTFARGGSAFAAAELEPFLVKGKSEPVHALVLGELVSEDERAAAPEATQVEDALPFFDRERERAVLGASVAPVRMGFGTLVELVGEPGIGKSRLAQELRENCSDMRQIELRCEQYEVSTPYFPFRPFLRSLLDVQLNGGGAHNRTVLSDRLQQIDEELVPWAPLLAAPLDVDVESTPEVEDLDPSFWRARLHGVMGTLLGRLLDSPTLLVFDDVHWMDDASSELLRHLGAQLPTKPWLACTTRRPGEEGFAAATGTPPLPALTLRLEPLPEEDARALAVAAAGDRRLTEEEVAALMERAAGNPLFLRELASVGEKTDDAEDLPETVGGLVATRIDKLAPGDRALLRWASVLGVSFSGSLIAQVLEDDPNVAAASESWDRLGEFVERDPDVPGAFRFRHALIRDAAYEGLSYKRRRELHGKVADVIQARGGDEAAEILALHYLRAARWPETWKCSVEAGRRAEEKYANVEAAQFLEQALDAAKRVPDIPSKELSSVATALGDVRVLLGHYEAAREAFRIAETHLQGDEVEYARLAQKRHWVPFRLGKHAQALRWLTRGIAALEGREERDAIVERARLMACYATVRQVQRRPPDAIYWARQAIEEAERCGEREAEAAAYYILDWAHVALGKEQEAVYGERALEIYQEIGNKKRISAVLNHLAMRAYLGGRWDDCLALAHRAQAASNAIGDRWSAAAVGFNIGETLADQGRFDEAEPVVRKSMTVWGDDGATTDAAEASSLLGRILTHLGRFEEAEGLLTDALEVFREAEDDVEELKAEGRLAYLTLLRGNASGAVAELESALAKAQGSEGVASLTAALQRVYGVALAACGRVEDAHAALEEAIRLANSSDANFGLKSTEYEIGETYRELARLPGISDDEAAAYAAKGLAILEPFGVIAR